MSFTLVFDKKFLKLASIGLNYNSTKYWKSIQSFCKVGGRWWLRCIC